MQQTFSQQDLQQDLQQAQLLRRAMKTFSCKSNVRAILVFIIGVGLFQRHPQYLKFRVQQSCQPGMFH
jgi:hypothetical protein